MKLYISGPMRGIPAYNFPAFDSLADYLRSRNYEYINPADHDREVDPDCEQRPDFATGDPSLANLDNFHQLLGWDLAQIASPECDGVVMLPGWENSTGAQHERYVAEACGKAVFLVKKTQMHELWTLESCNDRSLSAKRKLSDDFHPTRRLEGSLQPTPTPVVPQGSDCACGRYQDEQHKADCLQSAEAIDAGHAFTTKDSGVRAQYASGMVRDTDEGKPRYDLIPLLPLRRLAELLARGAVKYGQRNWEQASSQEEVDRFKASAFRHFVQWLDGERDEDHASAIVFNVWAATVTEDKING